MQTMCNTSSVIYAQRRVTCHVVRRDSSAVKFNRVEMAFILLAGPLTDEDGKKTGVPGETPDDELHSQTRTFMSERKHACTRATVVCFHYTFRLADRVAGKGQTAELLLGRSRQSFSPRQAGRREQYSCFSRKYRTHYGALQTCQPSEGH